MKLTKTLLPQTGWEQVLASLPRSAQSLFEQDRRLRRHGVFDALFLVSLILGPFAWMLGNAALDAWLVLIEVFFVVDIILSNRERHRKFLAEIKWLAIVFGLLVSWGLVVSVLSINPSSAISQQLQFIRFPLFAVGLYYLFKDRPQHLRWFLLATSAALAVLCIWLWVERITVPRSIRLSGPWGQGPFINTFVSSVGLIVIGYWLVQSRRFWSLCLVALLAAAVLSTSFSTAEVYMTMIAILGIGVMFLLTPRSWPIAIVVTLCTFLVGSVIFKSYPWIWHRMVVKVPERLPWRETSDYFPPWTNAFNFGLSNPLFGIGPGNYTEHCKLVDGLRSFRFPEFCNSHPHQLYLQYFAETGLPGLLLFLLFAVSIIWLCVKNLRAKRLFALAAVAALLCAAFWPVSTFGNAFGQLRNFFMWLLVGMALVYASGALVKTDQPENSERGAS